MNSQSQDKVGRSRRKLKKDEGSGSPVIGAVEGIGGVSYGEVEILNQLEASDPTETDKAMGFLMVDIHLCKILHVILWVP